MTIETNMKRKSLFSKITAGVFILLIIILLFLPKTYTSESTIKLGSIDDFSISPAEAKNIIKTDSILEDVVNKYYPEKSLRKFIDKNLEIKIIIEEIGLRETEIIDYIKIKTKADNPEKAKEINEKISENFVNYASEEYNKKKEFLVEQEEEKKTQITEIELYLSSLKKEIELSSSSELKSEGITKVSLINNLISVYQETLFIQKNELNEIQKKLLDAKEFEIISKSSLPNNYSSPSLLSYLIFSLILSLALAFLVTYLIENKK